LDDIQFGDAFELQLFRVLITEFIESANKVSGDLFNCYQLLAWKPGNLSELAHRTYEIR